VSQTPQVFVTAKYKCVPLHKHPSMKKKTHRINLIKSLPIVRSIKDVQYEPEFYFSYQQDDTHKKLPYVFQTQISEKEKGAIIKERNKKMIIKSAVFGFSAFISIAVMSVLRGNEFTMEHFLAFLIQVVMMIAAVSIILIVVSIILPKAYPDKILFTENRLKVINSKGKVDIDIPYTDIAYFNIVRKKHQKFLCFSTLGGDEGSILRNSPIFDITNKSDEIFLTNFLKKLAQQTGAPFKERKLNG